jgi:phage terminase large subunit
LAPSGQVYLLHCLSTSGASLEWWRDEIEKVHKEHGWRHGKDIVPHDAKVLELGTGRTRVETMKALGLNPVLAPAASLQDGINAVRRTLPYCVFHPRCEEKGIPALEQYQREWDDEKKCFRASPLHDWCSDRVDSFRYMSLSWKREPPRVIKLPKPVGWHIPPPEEPRRGGLRL